MKNCKMCGTSIPDGVDECPNCKFKISSSKKINRLQTGIKGYYVFFIIIAIAILAMPVYFGIKYSKESKDMQDSMKDTFNEATGYFNKEEKEELAKNIELLEGTKITQETFYYIEGKLQNNNNKDVKSVTVTFALYNEDGSLVDTKRDIISLIEANGTYQFKISCGFTKPNNFKLKSIEIN